MNKEILNAILRTDFKSFVIKVFNDVSAGSEYLDNWHVDVICDELMNMLENKNNRLIINVPPRYLKSIICSVALPAFLLGHNPTANIICVSYSDDLATKFANDCRNIMTSEWYHDLFPLTRISHSQKSVTDFRTTHGGGRLATSIGGMLTGRGADWIIIDDPLKPMDAMSDLQRDKVNDWFGSTLYSRLNDKAMGKILLIMQRLHQSDLTGYLLESNSRFKHIKLPIMAESDEKWEIANRISGGLRVVNRNNGELLHGAREDMDVIADLRTSLGEFAFAGQYQQRPSPIEGGLIKKGWISYWNELPEKFGRIVLSWDTAAKTGLKNAYSACVILGIDHKNNVYILDVYRERLEFPELVKKIEQMHMEQYDKYNEPGRYNTHVSTLIEEASSGIQAIQQLKPIVRRGDGIIAIKPSTDKISRLTGISSLIENGRVLFPAKAGPWWPDFEKELLTFPASTFKDQCDALSQAIEYATGPGRYREIRCTVLG